MNITLLKLIFCDTSYFSGGAGSEVGNGVYMVGRNDIGEGVYTCVKCYSNNTGGRIGLAGWLSR